MIRKSMRLGFDPAGENRLSDKINAENEESVIRSNWIGSRSGRGLGQTERSAPAVSG
jgi:hypothetical protein